VRTSSFAGSNGDTARVLSEPHTMVLLREPSRRLSRAAQARVPSAESVDGGTHNASGNEAIGKADIAQLDLFVPYLRKLRRLRRCRETDCVAGHVRFEVRRETGKE
jgi:hypothetical protein